MNTQKLKLFVLALLAFFIIAVMFSCSIGKELTGIEYHQKLQKENTFANAMKNNESFTLESYMDDLKTLKGKINELNKKDITEQKKAEILAEIQALKASIK